MPSKTEIFVAVMVGILILGTGALIFSNIYNAVGLWNTILLTLAALPFVWLYHKVRSEKEKDTKVEVSE